jgi:hypothetical protein
MENHAPQGEEKNHAQLEEWKAMRHREMRKPRGEEKTTCYKNGYIYSFFSFFPILYLFLLLLKFRALI